MKMPRWMWAVLALLTYFPFSAATVRAQDRFALGAQVGFATMPELGETRAGYGFRFTYGFYQPFLALDTELDSFPTSSGGNLGDTQVFVGLKEGFRAGRFGFFVKARPGFDYFSGGDDPQRLTHQTNFAFDLGGGLEYYFAPHLALRWDLSDVLTCFGSGEVLGGAGGPIGVPLGTRGSFQSTVGLLVHF